jgi:hypothetical protein
MDLKEGGQKIFRHPSTCHSRINHLGVSLALGAASLDEPDFRVSTALSLRQMMGVGKRRVSSL